MKLYTGYLINPDRPEPVIAVDHVGYFGRRYTVALPMLGVNEAWSGNPPEDPQFDWGGFNPACWITAYSLLRDAVGANVGLPECNQLAGEFMRHVVVEFDAEGFSIGDWQIRVWVVEALEQLRAKR